MAEMEKKPVIIDCDTGVDDALALLLCLKRLDVVGITAVGGNVGLAATQRNTRFVVETAGRPYWTVVKRGPNFPGQG